MTDAATDGEIRHIFDMAVDAVEPYRARKCRESDAAAWRKAYADASGIAYGRACRLVMEPIDCRRHVI